MKSEEFLTLVSEYRNSGGFTYDLGKGKFFDDVFKSATPDQKSVLDSRRMNMLRRALRQPGALYCGVVQPHDTPVCCYVHIAKHRTIEQWEKASEDLDAHLRQKITRCDRKERSPDEVLQCIYADGLQAGEPPKQWQDAFAWLKTVLPMAFSATRKAGDHIPTQQQLSQILHADAVMDVIDAANKLTPIINNPVRAGQLAAVLLNVYGSETGTKLQVEMKTGEGKTFVCAISAAVIAKRCPQGAALILTASMTRAEDDKKSTQKLLDSILGEGKCVYVSELKLGVGGQVAYGQVTDIQKIVVDALQNGAVEQLYRWLGSCSICVDESDHVFIEQAENLLYIASACPSYYALSALVFQILFHLDRVADYQLDEAPNLSAIPEKAGKLTQKILDDIKDQGSEYPHVIDVDVCVSSWASGALSARLKSDSKEFVLEITSKSDHGTIENVRKITIMDTATGTESDGTRWTAEAPFVEGFHELPVGGSDPLAFYNAFPYLLRKIRWFGGITGTVGGSHNLDYYEKTYAIYVAMRIPRNFRNSIYHLESEVAHNEQSWVKNIVASIERWFRNGHGLHAKGPILVVTKNIKESWLIEEALRARGHIGMVLDDENNPASEDKQCWKMVDSTAGKSEHAHVFPYYRRDHKMMHKLPDAAIVIASNKGGRGLDLKLDGDCPELSGPLHRCTMAHPHIHHSRNTEMKSILFVILTDVLLGRQNEQACGRCGRSGKAGVIQYQLLEDKKPQPSCKDALCLERKLRKDQIEKSDLSSKCNRIGQHRIDGDLLDKFCKWFPDYVNEWMKKLFPSPSTKRSSSEKKTAPIPTPPSNIASTTSTTETTTNTNANTGTVPEEIKRVTREFITSNVTERWAYWRGYAPPRRGAGDPLDSFKKRMGLRPVQDLPYDAKDSNDFHCFATRFWRFACILRINGEAMYKYAKMLLRIKAGDHCKHFSLDILRQASSRSLSVKLIPGDAPWRPEFSGNAAILYAYIAQDPEALKLAIECIDRLIATFTCNKEMNKELDAKLVFRNSGIQRIPARDGKTYYMVQRAEIVRQLEFRKRSLTSLGSLSDLHDLRSAFDTHKDWEYLAYCLGYGWCLTIFDWYVGPSPFDEPLQQTSLWKAHLIQEAEKLGARPKKTKSSGGTGGGWTEVRDEESTKRAESQNRDILAAIHESASTNSTETFTWNATAPTAADIAATKEGTREWLLGGLSITWLASTFTAIAQPYKTTKRSGNVAPGCTSSLSEAVEKKITEITRGYRQGLTTLDANEVKLYIGQSVQDICEIAAMLGPRPQHSDFAQENVEVRTGGKTQKDISLAESKKRAKEESKERIHLADENLTPEQKNLVNDVLVVLKKLAETNKLDGFDVEFKQLLNAISEYNTFAMSGNTAGVDQAIVNKMNAAMKQLWQNVLSLAMEHGSQDELKPAMSKYDAAMTSKRVKIGLSVAATVVAVAGGWGLVGIGLGFGWLAGVSAGAAVTVGFWAPLVRDFNLAYGLVSETEVLYAIDIALTKIKNCWATKKAAALWTCMEEHAAKIFAHPKVQKLLDYLTQAMDDIGSTLHRWISWVKLPNVELGESATILCNQLKHWWQGEADIRMNDVWGNFEFDIIDLSRFPEGISKARMRMREGLKRVWAGSWLQWWLDPSLQLGLDQDEREHVQVAQDREHQTHLRLNHREQRGWSTLLAVFGFLMTIIALLGTIFTLGALAIPMIALCSAGVALCLQALSTHIENDISLTTDEKQTMLTLISIAQTVVLILSLCGGLFFASGSLAKAAQSISGSAARLLARLKNLLENAVGIIMRRKAFTEQLDRLLRALGLGGAAVIALGLKDSLLKLVDCALSLATHEVIQPLVNMLKTRSLNRKKQQEEKRQEENREKDQDEEEEKKTGGGSTAIRRTQHRIAYLPDGIQIVTHSDLHNLCTSSDCASGKNGYSVQQTISSHFIKSKDGDLAIDYVQKEGKVVVQYSRPGQKDLIDFKDLTAKEQQMLKDFKTPEDFKHGLEKLSQTAARQEMTTTTSETKTDKNGNATWEKHTKTSPKGTFTVLKSGGSFKVSLQPPCPATPSDASSPPQTMIELTEAGELKFTGPALTPDNTRMMLEMIGYNAAEVDEMMDQISFDEHGAAIPKNVSQKERLSKLKEMPDSNSKILQAVYFLHLKHSKVADVDMDRMLKAADHKDIARELGHRFVQNARSQGNDISLYRAAEQMTQQLRTDSSLVIDTEEFKQKVADVGAAKALFDTMHEATEGVPQHESESGLANEDPSAAAKLHDRMAAIGAAYSRLDTKFSHTKQGALGDSSTIPAAKTLLNQFSGLERRVSCEKIHDDVQGFLRIGDLDSLNKYFQSKMQALAPVR